MSLLTDIMGAMHMNPDHPQAQEHQNLMGSLATMLSNPQTGGINGLLDKLRSCGLGGAMQSWISTGHNQAVTPDQLHRALGDDQINQIAGNAGVSPQQASSGLSSLLPALVDKLSPNGQLHEESTMSKMLSALKQHLMSGPPQ
jgi:uncharacterized protein YidB (DUF937 family)